MIWLNAAKKPGSRAQLNAVVLAATAVSPDWVIIFLQETDGKLHGGDGEGEIQTKFWSWYRFWTSGSLARRVILHRKVKPLVAEIRAQGRSVLVSLNSRARRPQMQMASSDDPQLLRYKPVAKFVSVHAKHGELEVELANVRSLLGDSSGRCRNWIGGDWNHDLLPAFRVSATLDWLEQHCAVAGFCQAMRLAISEPSMMINSEQFARVHD
jgi:hypothetical protein